MFQETFCPLAHPVIVHLELQQVPEEELSVRSVSVHDDVVDLLPLDLPQHLSVIKEPSMISMSRYIKITIYIKGAIIGQF